MCKFGVNPIFYISLSCYKKEHNVLFGTYQVRARGEK